MLNIKEVLEDHKSKIESLLEEYFQDARQKYSEFPDYIKEFVEHTAEFTLRGGKRIRPILIYYSYKLFSDKNLEEVIKTSIFIELIHSYLLIHDDIMDRSDLRRGLPTVHKIHEEISRRQEFNDDKHFGNAMAILSGDLACQLAYEIISNSSFEEGHRNELTRLVSEELNTVVLGQIGDIMLSYKKDFTEIDVDYVHKHKTAVYTFRLPLFAGAILAGVDKDQFPILEKYAIPCGIAFQIRDDILGVFGEDKDTGKSSISDITEGKKTLLVYHAYKNGSDGDKSRLDSYLGKQDLTDTEAEEVRDIFRKTGALDYSITKCEERVKEAKEVLQLLSGKNPEAVQFLESLADYMVVRDI